MTRHARAAIEIERPVIVDRAFRSLRMGKFDPTTRIEGGELWRAIASPEGPVTICVRVEEPGLSVEAWGPGADWAIARAPRYSRAPTPDRARLREDPRIAPLVARHLSALAIMPAISIAAVAIAAAIQQRVTWREAVNSYRRLCKQLGDPAPGPLDLVTGPRPAALAATPYYALRPLGIDRARAERLASIAGAARHLEAAGDLPVEAATTTIRKIRGIGPWTGGMIGGIALADPDAVPVGDASLPRMVSWALAREPYGDDDRMLELLAPFAPQRWWVLGLLRASGARAPTRGGRRRR